MRSQPAVAALALLPVLLLPIAAAAEAPVAFFTLEPGVVATGAAVRADATDSRPSDLATNITEHAWRWSEAGAFEPGNATEAHEYAAAGVHVVTLRITDDAGRVAFANQSVLVVGALPQAYFVIESVGEVGGDLVVQVNATFSAPSAGAARLVRYEWRWGEPGSEFVEGNATETHVYDDIRSYTITLRVTDDEGRQATVNEPVVFGAGFLSRLRVLWEDREAFIDGAILTLQLAIVSTILGFVVAVAVALLRISRHRVLRWPAAAYIEVIRGTPLLVQILIAWLVLPFVGVKLPILWAGALALIVNTSAYQAEAIRGGIQAIPSGQMEAATSLGMTYLQSMRHVILPQAFRLTLPPLGNEFIILLKDTSLVSVIGVVELAKVAQIFSARTFLVLETFLAIALVYFVMTFTLSWGLRRLERRLAIPGLGLQGAST